MQVLEISNRYWYTRPTTCTWWYLRSGQCLYLVNKNIHNLFIIYELARIVWSSYYEQTLVCTNCEKVISSNHLISIFLTLLTHVHQAVNSGKKIYRRIWLGFVCVGVLKWNFLIYLGLKAHSIWKKSIWVVLPTTRWKKIDSKTQTQWKMPENAIKSTKSD